MTRTEEVTGILRAEIHSGQYPENGPFCSEHRLCERFALSRMTIRNILHTLEAERLIFRIPKRGTFLAPRQERERLRLALLIDREAYLDSPFLARVLSGVNRALQTDNVTLTLASRVEDLLRRTGDDGYHGGLVLPGVFEEDALRRIAELPLPVFRIAETAAPLPGMHLHFADAARELCAGLRQRGARRIAILAGHGGFLDREKVRGIQQALAGAGSPMAPPIACTQYETGRVAPVLREWFAANRPDTIIAFDDTLALAAVQWLHHEGIPIPDAVMVTGFNDMPFAAMMAPSLTSVAIPIEQAAISATRMLLTTLRHGSIPRDTELSCHIHWRSSTGENV